MKGWVVVLIAVMVLLGAAGAAVGLLAKSGPDNHERPPAESATAIPSTEIPSTEKTTETTTTSAGPDREESLKLVRSRAEKYIAAINARDEPAAAPFTCGKKNASLLWIVAAGRKITLLDLDGPIPPPPTPELGQLPWWSVRAKIRIEGEPSATPIVFVLKDGEWCVYP